MTTQHTESKPAGLPAIDVSEYGGKKDGERQAMNRRLFMQLLVFDVPEGGDAGSTADDVAALLQKKEVPHVLYADAMAPRGLGLLTWAEDPAHFVREADHFSECVMQNKEPVAPGEEGLRDMRLIEAIYKSCGLKLGV